MHYAVEEEAEPGPTAADACPGGSNFSFDYDAAGDRKRGEHAYSTPSAREGIIIGLSTRAAGVAAFTSPAWGMGVPDRPDPGAVEWPCGEVDA